MLADAARLGVIRRGRPEAWAAGAVIAVARASGLLGTGRPLTAQQVADELDVTLGALAVTERELARALNLALRAPPARGLRPDRPVPTRKWDRRRTPACVPAAA